ncbi:hypothetical protein KGM_200351 [Danaus plexippus plexippus]|uniref:Uncharacterized protein n=1 Tax=Danaus plexippus plexippus TaxID=278856 RepID=A0A212EP71_DANPL|nr:hypothetical protein KGM_200351 [Danaus plexippus plexippus]
MGVVPGVYYDNRISRKRAPSRFRFVEGARRELSTGSGD